MANRTWAETHDRTLLQVTGVLSGLCVTWFAIGFVYEPPSALLIWLPQPPAAVLAAVQCRMAARDRSLTVEGQRFWHVFSVGVALLAAAAIATIYPTLPAGGVLIGPPGPLALAIFSAAIAAFMWALFRLPSGARNSQQRLTLWYDVGTVMLAAALFLWHFNTRSQVSRGVAALPQTAASLATMILGFVVIFTLAKTALTASRTVDRRALRLLAMGAVLGCGGAGIEPLVSGLPRHLNVAHYTMPLATFYAAWSAYAQRHPRETKPSRRLRSDRPFSLFPYIAVAAADLLLLVTTIFADGDDGPVLATGAVALTALVVVRQLTAFRENARLLDQLARHERRFRSLVQNSSDIVSITTADGMISYLSPSVQRVLGVEVGSWVGRSVWSVVHPDDHGAARRAMDAIAATPNAATTYRIRLAHADGTWRWTEVISSNLLDDASVNGIVSNARDITEAREFQNRLHHEATHDPLTGLANRALFAERIEQAVADDTVFDTVVALIDLNDFKVINDSLGHAAGDQLLIAVARRLSHNVRSQDTVARLGGDEFALLLTDMPHPEVDTTLNRIHHELVQPVLTHDREVRVGASIGVAQRMAGERPDDLLHRADIAMYASKSRGDGAHTYHTPELTESATNRVEGSDLRLALDTDQFRVFYQPVVTLPDGELSGVEALLRWQHPTRGLLGPVEFIPAAEKSGLIVELGDWVLRTACRQQAAWLRDFNVGAPAAVAVNVSPRQLREPAFAQQIADALSSSQLGPERLVLEITESGTVSGGATEANLTTLRAIGIRLSLDDFGTGHSTLNLLETLPVTQIKLDRSFTATCLTAGPHSVATAVIRMAQALGLDVVAEGVETSQQAVHLHALGYRSAQGYHFHRPMPAQQATLIIETRSRRAASQAA